MTLFLLEISLFLQISILVYSQAIRIGAGVGNQYCPDGMIQLLNGVSCKNDQNCQHHANGFFCYHGYCCSQKNPPPSGYGSSCTYTNQCLFPNSKCRNNICYCRSEYDYNGFQCVGSSIRSGVGGICLNGATAEFNGYGFKDCLYHSCRPGYQCEYNYNRDQYLCCSNRNRNYGQIKMYLSSNLPLKCTAINGCLFVDYPYCVYSQLYEHSVCCSTKQCR